MFVDKIIVDTNIFIHIMKGKRELANKIKSYDKIFISPVILAELNFGAYRSENPEKELRKVNQAIEASELLPINTATVDFFVKIKIALAAKGKLIPENDMWIASAALEHQFPLYTLDQHFERIDRLILN